MPDNNDRKFLKGAAVLAGAGILMKLLGAVFRIPLTNWIGDGMAYYSVAYAIYGTLVVIGTAGVPIAISKLVSENIVQGKYRNAHKVFHVATLLMLAIGTTGFLICFFGADLIAGLIKSPKSAPAIRAMSPALFFVPLFSSFRGFFNGRQNMNPTAVSEITEQLVRCGVGLSLAYMMSHPVLNEVNAAAGASLGASVGAIAGLLIIFMIFLLNKKPFEYKIEHGIQEVEDGKVLAKRIAWIAVPIIIGSEIMPIMTVIDTGIVMNVLQANGWSRAVTEHLYGLYGGYCNSIIAFPQIFTQAVAVSLVPAISAHFAKKDSGRVNDTTNLGYRTTMIMGFPCALGLFVIAEPILKLMYFRQPKSCEEAAPIMMIMAISVIFLAHMQTSVSVLQAVGKQLLPVRNLAFACIGKVVVTYLTVSIHAINVKGAAIGTMFAYIVTLLLNEYSVKKYTGLKHQISLTYVRPGAAALGMAAVTYGVYRLVTYILAGHGANVVNAAGVLAAILCAAAVYVILLFAFKAIKMEELDNFPGGKRLAKILQKFLPKVLLR